MKIVKALVGTALLAVTPLAAQADDMSYSFVDLAWLNINPDGGGSSEDGFGLRGSIGFAENFFGYVEYSNFDLGPVDLELYSVGLGGHYGISDKVDLQGRIGYAKFDAGPIDDDGYEVAAGLRGQVAEGFELEGNVYYQDFGGTDGDDTQFGVGGRYFFTENFGVGAEYRVGDDFDTAIVHVRFQF